MKSSNVVLAWTLVFAVLTWAAADDGQKPVDLVGNWKVEVEGYDVRLSFARDGSFVREERNGETTRSVPGRYRVESSTLEMTDDCDEMPVAFEVRGLDANRLELTAPDGFVFQIAREGGRAERETRETPDPTPKHSVESLLGTWSYKSSDITGRTLRFLADGTVRILSVDAWLGDSKTTGTYALRGDELEITVRLEGGKDDVQTYHILQLNQETLELDGPYMVEKFSKE